MQRLLIGPCVLILAASVFSDLDIDSGCQRWRFSGNEVCCEACKAGNRLVKSCGANHTMLCTPCEHDTYTVSPSEFYCRRCTQCTGVQVTKTPCTRSSDTECGCRDGLRCGNDKCSFCVDECGKGEEPTLKRSCQKCPAGTFNNKIHQKCIPWRKSCPDGMVLDKNGDAFSDRTCKVVLPLLHLNQKTNTKDDQKIIQGTATLPTRSIHDDSKWMTQVWIAIGCGALCVFILFSVAATMKCFTSKERNKKANFEEAPTEEHRKMEVEQEDCSFRHPQQEQGGSSDSIASQDSEAKLLV